METSAGHFPPNPSSGRGARKQRACAAWLTLLTARLAIRAHNMLGSKEGRAASCTSSGARSQCCLQTAQCSADTAAQGPSWSAVPAKEGVRTSAHLCLGSGISLCSTLVSHKGLPFGGKRGGKGHSYLELILLSFSQLTNHNLSVHLVHQQRWSPKC